MSTLNNVDSFSVPCSTKIINEEKEEDFKLKSAQKQEEEEKLATLLQTNPNNNNPNNNITSTPFSSLQNTEEEVASSSSSSSTTFSSRSSRLSSNKNNNNFTNNLIVTSRSDEEDLNKNEQLINHKSNNNNNNNNNNFLLEIFERIFFGNSNNNLVGDNNQRLSSGDHHRFIHNNNQDIRSHQQLLAQSSSSTSNLSDSLSYLYLPVPVQQLTSSIMSGINWINQLELSQSAVLQYISTLNPFRRRGSTTSTTTATGSATLKQNTSGGVVGINASSSSSTITAASSSKKSKCDLDPFFYSQSTLQNRSFARILNDTMQTLKPSELIELSSFGLVEVDNVESGIGHEFQRYENDKPTWCDSCGEFLSTPVMNSTSTTTTANDNHNNSSNNNNNLTISGTKSISSHNNNNASQQSYENGTIPVQVSCAPAAVQVEHVMRTYLYCRKCKYVCHVKCYGLIRIDCRPSSLLLSSNSSSIVGGDQDISNRNSLETSTTTDDNMRNMADEFSVDSLDDNADGLSIIDSNNNKNDNGVGDESSNNNRSNEQRRRRRQRQQQRRQRRTEFSEALNNGSITAALQASESLNQQSEIDSMEVNINTTKTAASTTTTSSTLCNKTLNLEESQEIVNDITEQNDINDEEYEDDSTCASLSEAFPSEINSNIGELSIGEGGCDTTTITSGTNANANNNISMSTSISSSIDQTMNCSSSTSTSTSSSTSTNASSAFDSFDGSILTPTEIVNLKEKILKYNEKVRGKGSGLGITLINQQEQLFRGFLRVHMNLTRPINVISGKRPPSIYDIINEEENNNNNNNKQLRTLTSFYMPRDTVKNIHITSDSTSLQVIKAMLKKFKVVDNPQKFALYLRRRYPEEDQAKLASNDEITGGGDGTKSNKTNEWTIRKFLTASCYDHSLKRLNDQEFPLVLQLEFDSYLYGSVDIVLQENDNADIAWDAFEIPELKNFLRILDREEREHLEHVIAHYREMKHLIGELVQYRDAKQQFYIQQQQQQQQQKQQLNQQKQSSEDSEDSSKIIQQEEEPELADSPTDLDNRTESSLAAAATTTTTTNQQNPSTILIET